MKNSQQIYESKWFYLAIFIVVGYVGAYGYRNWLPKKED